MTDWEKLKHLDLFSGIGGFSLGLECTGLVETVGFCDNDPFCKKVIAQHWPGVPFYDDIEAMPFDDLGRIDIITGGFPCQDVSLAGKRAGLTGERSGLYRELVRALRVVRPRYGIVENVAALLNDGMGTVLGDLAESGIDTEWDCVPAQALGAPHRRDRVFIVTHAEHDGSHATAVRRSVGTSEEKGRLRELEGRATSSADASHTAGKPLGPGGQSRVEGSLEGDHEPPAPEGIGCGQRRSWRPPDSFARIRELARRNAADPYGAHVSFADNNGELWPDEPALSGVDDGIPDWMDRVRVTGNTILPQIPELILPAAYCRTLEE